MKPLLDKLIARGAAALDDDELLALVLGEGSASCRPEGLAGRLMAHYGGSLARMGRDDLHRLRMVEGVGVQRAARIAASAELGRRILRDEAAGATTISTSEDIVALFRPQFAELRHEECWVVYLTASNRILERRRMSQGGVQGTVVDHRLVVKRALELLSTQFILVHNHPSGSAEPSAPDKELTRRIVEAAALFDIRVLDHVIIALSGGDFSFRSAGLIG